MNKEKTAKTSSEVEISIPERKDIPASDKWDLSKLYVSNGDWEKSIASIPILANALLEYKGHLAESSAILLEALKKLEELEKECETAGNYAFLLAAGDAGDSSNQDKQGRYIMTAAAAETQTSFFTPELQSIPESSIQKWITLPEFANYKIFLQKLLRMKPYILSEKEERLISLQAESSETAQKAFSMLTNVDIDYGTVTTEQGEEPLSQTTWSVFMESPNRETRKEAYTKFYKAFDTHKNTIAALYSGSVNQDIFEARSRGYNTAREAALFPDDVPISVYDNLIQTVRSNLDSLHEYYSIRKKALKLNELRHYDVYVPIVPEFKKITPYNEAVEIVRNALSPLGSEYTDTLCNGLKSGWVDRYENKGKRSGAFSSGGYKGYPYILLNYKQDVLRDVFTIAHEGGHSMHSWYSANSNPFMQYNYTIFEAEVASTFNEQLVFEYMLKNADSNEMRAYLLSMRAGDILATLHRQTMFAEYELRTHELVESGTPLSADVLRAEYRKLLEIYFDPEMIFEKESDLEGMRIPHFYNAFYVYKYSTGISAALALAKRVLNGGKSECNDYFNFLRSGGSRYPIDSLKAAGVDMTTTKPVQDALDYFNNLISELKTVIK